jgi:hypothetical protein
VKILDRTHPAINPIPRRPRTMGDLLDLFVEAISANDYEVEAGSIDTQGVTIADSRNGLLYRVEVTEEGMLDDAEWQRRSDAGAARELATASREFEEFLRAEDARQKQEDARDVWESQQQKSWLNSTQVDPAGFNGQENPDDVEF